MLLVSMIISHLTSGPFSVRTTTLFSTSTSSSSLSSPPYTRNKNYTESFQVEVRTLITEIDQYTEQQVQKCLKLSTLDNPEYKNASSIIHTINFNDNQCPLRTKRVPSRAALYYDNNKSNTMNDNNNNNGTGSEEGSTEAEVIVGVNKEGFLMCNIIAQCMNTSFLPSSIMNIQKSYLTLIDIGAAFGNELLIGYQMKFQTISIEARKSEYDLLIKDWGNIGGGSNSKGNEPSSSQYQQPTTTTTTIPPPRIIQAAITNITGGIGTVDLYNARDSSSLHQNAVNYGAELKKVQDEIKRGNNLIETVPAITIDYLMMYHLWQPQQLQQQLLSRESRVAFIKIDIQGHEYEALLSAYGILQKYKPILYFEYTNFRGVDAPKVLCYVQKLGYQCLRRKMNMVLCIHPNQPKYE